MSEHEWKEVDEIVRQAIVTGYDAAHAGLYPAKKWIEIDRKAAAEVLVLNALPREFLADVGFGKYLPAKNA